MLFLLITAVLATLSLLSSCTNDLKKIQEISQKVVNSPADTTRGVHIIYSDSAHVKAEIFTPLMLEYETGANANSSRKVMPKGVKIIFYDNDLREEANIVADTAYYMEAQKLIKFRKNVVLTSAKGDVFTSEELNYDGLKHLITSSKPVDIVKANGDKGHGTSLQTNEKMSPLSIENLTGNLYVDSKMGQ